MGEGNERRTVIQACLEHGCPADKLAGSLWRRPMSSTVRHRAWCGQVIPCAVATHRRHFSVECGGWEHERLAAMASIRIATQQLRRRLGPQVVLSADARFRASFDGSKLSFLPAAVVRLLVRTR